MHVETDSNVYREGGNFAEEEERAAARHADDVIEVGEAAASTPLEHTPAARAISRPHGMAGYEREYEYYGWSTEHTIGMEYVGRGRREGREREKWLYGGPLRHSSRGHCS